MSSLYGLPKGFLGFIHCTLYKSFKPLIKLLYSSCNEATLYIKLYIESSLFGNRLKPAYLFQLFDVSTDMVDPTFSGAI